MQSALNFFVCSPHEERRVTADMKNLKTVSWSDPVGLSGGSSSKSNPISLFAAAVAVAEGIEGDVERDLEVEEAVTSAAKDIWYR